MAVHPVRKVSKLPLELIEGSTAADKAVDRLLLSATAPVPPAHFTSQVMLRLERREQARRALLGSLLLISGTVVVALLLVVPLLLQVIDLSQIGVTLLALLDGLLETLSLLAVPLGYAARTLTGNLWRPALLCTLGAVLLTVGLSITWLTLVRKVYTRA